MLKSRHFDSQQAARQAAAYVPLGERMQQWWLPLGLVGVLLASFWLARYLGDDAPPPPPPAEDLSPDYTLRDFVITTLDTRGQLVRQVQSLDGAYYPNRETELTEPYLVLYIEGKPVWYMRAERGWSSADGDQMILLGETQLWRYGPQGALELHMLSRDVLLRPNEMYAETAAPVTLSTPRGSVKSVGMRAYMVLRQVELLANVEGSYETR